MPPPSKLANFNHSQSAIRRLVGTPDPAQAHDLQYMLGEALLVVPVVTEATSRTVYLPGSSEEGWVDFWTGEVTAGGQTVREPRRTLCPVPACGGTG